MAAKKEKIKTALGLGPGHLIRVTGPRGGLRHYEMPGRLGKMPSVTTLIGNAVRKPGLERWRESKIRQGLDPTADGREAARRGTELHALIDELLRTGTADVPREYQRAVDGFLAWVRDSGLSYRESEVAVYSAVDLDPAWGGDPSPNGHSAESSLTGTGYAGTIDAIFESVGGADDGAVTLVDWKTGSTRTGRGIYPEHMMQLTAYMSCLFQMGFGGEVFGQVIKFGKDPESGEFDGHVEVANIDPLRWLNGWQGVFYLAQALEQDFDTERFFVEEISV